MTDDKDRFFLDANGTPSRVINQYDRFSNVDKWIDSGILYDIVGSLIQKQKSQK